MSTADRGGELFSVTCTIAYDMEAAECADRKVLRGVMLRWRKCGACSVVIRLPKSMFPSGR